MSKEKDPGVIYGVIHNDRPDKIRYVGLTTNLPKRITAHWADSRKSRTAFHKFLTKYRPDRKKIQFVILEQATRENLPELEEKWIKKLRLAGQADLNLTDGGDGRKGYTPDPETVEKFREYLYTRTGELAHNRKLDWDSVRKIREDAAGEWISGTDLAKKYEVTPATIRNILLNKNWVDESYDPSKIVPIPEDEKKVNVSAGWGVVNEIRELRKRRYVSIPTLSRQYDLSVAAIHRILENTSWVDGDYNPEHLIADPRLITPEEVSQVVELRHAGLTFASIAEALGRSKLQVNRAYRREMSK